jgi:hypothetical protein
MEPPAGAFSDWRWGGFWNESVLGRIVFEVFIGTAGAFVSISPEYHRRQAATLTQFARTTRDPDTAKELLRIAAEHLVRADEAVPTLTPVERPSINNRRPQ